MSIRDSLNLRLARSPKSRGLVGSCAPPSYPAPSLPRNLPSDPQPSSSPFGEDDTVKANDMSRSQAAYHLTSQQLIQVDYAHVGSGSTTPTATPPPSLGIPSPHSPGRSVATSPVADSLYGSGHGPTPSSSFEDLITSILTERNKDLGEHSRLKIPMSRRPDERTCGFVMVNVDTFWSHLFLEHFIQAADHELRDDMLMFVRKVPTNNSAIKTEVEVYRRVSPNLPSLGDPSIDWEETVYLNLILQQFEYTLTVAVCTRTGEKDLQILKKFSQQVYASPSKRQMDGKGEGEVIAYPNISSPSTTLMRSSRTLPSGTVNASAWNCSPATRPSTSPASSSSGPSSTRL